MTSGRVETPTLSRGDGSEVESTWEAEAERRYRQYLAGEMDGVSAADALAQIRADLSQ